MSRRTRERFPIRKDNSVTEWDIFGNAIERNNGFSQNNERATDPEEWPRNGGHAMRHSHTFESVRMNDYA
jgi:hypothetical protein